MVFCFVHSFWIGCCCRQDTCLATALFWLPAVVMESIHCIFSISLLPQPFSGVWILFCFMHPSPPLYPYCIVYGYTATKEPELILLMRTDMWAVSGNQTCFFDAPIAEYVKNREKVSPVDSHCCLFLQSFTAPSCTDSSSTLRTEMLQKLCWRSGAWRTFALALKVKLSPQQGKC